MRRIPYTPSLILSAVLVAVGCEAPPIATTAPSTAAGPIGYFETLEGSASVDIRLIDNRQTTQALADADDFNGVLFEIRNAQKLMAPRKAAAAPVHGTYETVFSRLPADAAQNYTLTAGLFRGVSAPASAGDPAYATMDQKVGEGASVAFSLASGEQKTLTIVINAVGTISFESTSATVDPATPSFAPGDATAAGLLSLSQAKNPLATGVNFAVKQSNGTTVATGSVPVAQWAALPAQTRLPFAVPTTEATYSFVVDMVNGSTVLSRRRREFEVKSSVVTLTVTGAYASMKVNGQAWSNSWSTTYKVPASGTSRTVNFVNSSSEWLYISYSGGYVNLAPATSASRSVPVQSGEISIYMDTGP